MKKECIPIVSCNPTYLGLDVPMWALNFVVFAIEIYLLSFFVSGFAPMFVCIGIQIFLNYIYVKVVLKLEENIGAVFLMNSKIPNVVYGYFDHLPEKPKRLDEDGEDAGSNCG